MNDSKFEVLMGMGEDPREYGEMMEALLEDLQLGFGEPSGRPDGRNVLADAALPAHP